MSNMKMKADENLIAAEILVSSNMLSSSVHCYYYSMFQLSKYILAVFHDIDYKRQNSECIGKDSHKHIIEITANFLEQKDNLYKADYNFYMGNLKKLRKKADYSNIPVIAKEVEEAKLATKKLTSLLKENYAL